MAVDMVEAVISNPAVMAGVVGVVSVVALLKYLSASNGNNRGPTMPKLGPPPKFSSSDPDIIVVGGGILGASFSARFGMSGKKVVMIERDMGTDGTFRGEVLLPGGIRCLEKMGMKDALDEIDGNPVAGEVYFDMRMGGEPGYIHYPEPGALAMRHGYLVNALRKKAMAQQTVTVIEATGRELIKENGRVVGVRYQVKRDDTVQEIRAPLVVVGDGYYSKLTAEYRTTNQPISDDMCIGLLMKNYEHKTEKKFMEFGIGHPDSQLCTYRLNERETRAVIFVHGQTPSNLKEFCEKKVVPHLPEHMKKPIIESLAEGPRAVRCKRMAANTDTAPGMLILGDALNLRHPVTAAGMTVALNDVNFWWDALLNKVNGLTDDEGIFNQKLIFRKERKNWAFVINVFAEIAIRLLNDHDPTAVTLQQFFIKDLLALAKDDTQKQAREDVYNIYGLVETDPKVMQRVLDAQIDGVVKEVYETRPYLSAVWESMLLRRKWNAMINDITVAEGMA